MLRIRYVPQIEGTPVVRFVAKAWVSLMDAGQWESSSVLVSGNLQCVFALDGRKIVGCLTFHCDDGAIVNIAYVVPSYRGKGVYRKLHDAFIEQAKKSGATKITNICYPTNDGMRETCKKLGYRLALEHWIRSI